MIGLPHGINPSEADTRPLIGHTRPLIGHSCLGAEVIVTPLGLGLGFHNSAICSVCRIMRLSRACSQYSTLTMHNM